MLSLGVVIASTRPGRVGPAVGKWFTQFARQHGTFDVHAIDLARVNLPIYDEPHHPRQQKYEHAHTKAWSKQVDALDAFVFVTPEYDHALPPSLLNAIIYLNKEWAYKPLGFVSYGGVSAGTRGVQMTKQVVVGLKVMPIPEAVNIPFIANHIEDGVFKATSVHTQPAAVMLDELHKWAQALKPLRTPAAVSV